MDPFGETVRLNSHKYTYYFYTTGGVSVGQKKTKSNTTKSVDVDPKTGTIFKAGLKLVCLCYLFFLVQILWLDFVILLRVDKIVITTITAAAAATTTTTF